jgi:hypothetical protein
MLFRGISKMKAITRYNYESFLVDYWDGQLSPALEEQLFSFLEENPDIKLKAEGAGNFALGNLVNGTEAEFAFKEDLRKPEVNRTNIDEFLVAELEAQLLPHQQNELNLFVIANPGFERDRRLYALTKVKPDAAVVYPDKRSLEKGKVFAFRYSSVAFAAAAACLVLAVSAMYSLNRKKVEIGESIATTNHISSPVQEKIVAAPDIIISTQEIDLVPPVTRVKNQPAVIQEEELPAEQKNTPSEIRQVRQVNNYVRSVPVSNATENFYTYSRNRKPDDYLQGLVNSYLNNTIGQGFSSEPVEMVTPPDNTPDEKTGLRKRISSLATNALKLVIHDEEFLSSINNNDMTAKAKLAEAFAFATGKVSKGKINVDPIIGDDGSLSALSFNSGKYSYMKKF